MLMVLRDVVLLAAVGIAISVPTALAASKLVESFLFGMKPNDPLALIGSVVTLVIAAILAGYLPAPRCFSNRSDDRTAARVKLVASSSASSVPSRGIKAREMHLEHTSCLVAKGRAIA
jgi:hypothetical protein